MLASVDGRAQGSLTNGWMHTGTISPAGDSDTWTFSANTGDTIILRVGEITTLSGSFSPRIRLFNPSSTQQALASSTLVAEIAVTATNSGLFTVIVDDAVGTTATGTYRLTLAQSPATIYVAPGDEGGPMTNGVQHTGTILPGDLDLYSFSANTGDAIVVRAGTVTTTNTFTPWVRLYGPDGRLLDSGFGTVAGEVEVTATNSGTFLAVVGDGNSVRSGSGDYRLTLAKTGVPVVVSAGDEGGPTTNGVMHLGTVLPGDLDVWTISANTGDNIVVRAGTITTTNTFTPWVRLYGPNGKLLDSGFGTVAGEVEVTATNSGTFLAVVGDGNSVRSGSGDYRLTLAKTGDAVVISAGDEGGPMTNGVMHLGTVLPGDVDVWTFSANNGEAIAVRAGTITTTNSFTPWVRLYGPNGKLVASGFGTLAGETATTATNTGIFVALISDGNSMRSGSGDYRLTLAKTGDAVVVSAGDEGGPLTNGVMHLGTILTGDLDVWTFNATNGDAVVLRVGMITSTSTFTPWIRLFGPDGKLLDSGYGTSAGEVTLTATNSGTFLAVVGDGNSVFSGSGAYRLTLAKTGDPLTVSASDEGGPMTNGIMHLGTISTGDLDVWTFSANSGDAIAVRVGELNNTNTFTPWVRLYGPNGQLVASGFGTMAGEAATTATNSGIFLALIGDGNSAFSGSGDYRLTLAKTGDPVMVSPGDEGGPLTNGVTHLGTILTGDLDVWTFGANAGDAIIVRVGELTDTNAFNPWVRLYGPNGKLLDSGFGTLAGEATTRATNSGAFMVVIGDGNSARNGSGGYRLTLARTGDGLNTSPGDEGGSLTAGVNPEGAITTGDVDVYAFTTCLGESINFKLDELTDTGSFFPWLRIYGPNGVLLRSVVGTTTAQITFTATNSGSFFAVVSDGNGALSGTGTYRLTGNGLSDEFRLCMPVISGTNVQLGAVGGTSNATFILFTETNVATPRELWLPILTNQFDQFGTFRRTNAFDRAEPQRFYNLLQQ